METICSVSMLESVDFLNLSIDADENVLLQHIPEFFRRKDGRMVREVNTDDQVVQPFVSYSAKTEVKVACYSVHNNFLHLLYLLLPNKK